MPGSSFPLGSYFEPFSYPFHSPPLIVGFVFHSFYLHSRGRHPFFFSSSRPLLPLIRSICRRFCDLEIRILSCPGSKLFLCPHPSSISERLPSTSPKEVGACDHPPLRRVLFPPTPIVFTVHCLPKAFPSLKARSCLGMKNYYPFFPVVPRPPP